MIRAAVIGVGSMGRNHARVYANMAGVQLVAVADMKDAKAKHIASTYGVRSYLDYREMLAQEQLDVVSVAVPTRDHASVARGVIEQGLHCFIEKPIALTVEEGRRIVRAANESGVKLGVGHIERYNPAVVELKHRLAAGQLGRVFQIYAHRVGPSPGRIEDVGVVFDLATHELNVMEHLIGSPIITMYAETEREIHEYHEDLLSALLKFEDGTVGGLDINWLTPKKTRELSVIGERGMFLLNYLTQELYFVENNYTNGQWEGLVALMGVSEGQRVKYEIRRQEPLSLELQAFVHAVQEDRPPLVSGEEALRAVYLASKLVLSGKEERIIRLDKEGNGDRVPFSTCFAQV